MQFTTQEELLDFLPTAQALLFDLDGTLVELNVDWRGIRDYMIADYEQKYGAPLQESRFWKMFAAIEARQGKAAANFYRNHNKAKELEAVRLGYPQVRKLLNPGLAVLSQLAPKNAIYGIISSNFHETIDRLLGTIELPVEFKYIIARDDVTAVKPNPEGLLRILETEKIDAKKVLYCGDLKSDLQAAEASGVHFIFVDLLQEYFGHKKLI